MINMLRRDRYLLPGVRRRRRRARHRQAVLAAQAEAQGRAVSAPRFEVDPLWPKPLPNHWLLG